MELTFLSLKLREELGSLSRTTSGTRGHLRRQGRAARRAPARPPPRSGTLSSGSASRRPPPEAPVIAPMPSPVPFAEKSPGATIPIVSADSTGSSPSRVSRSTAAPGAASAGVRKLICPGLTWSSRAAFKIAARAGPIIGSTVPSVPSPVIGRQDSDAVITRIGDVED